MEVMELLEEYQSQTKEARFIFQGHLDCPDVCGDGHLDHTDEHIDGSWDD